MRREDQRTGKKNGKDWKTRQPREGRIEKGEGCLASSPLAASPLCLPFPLSPSLISFRCLIARLGHNYTPPPPFPVADFLLRRSLAPILVAVPFRPVSIAVPFPRSRSLEASPCPVALNVVCTSPLAIW
ncbi:hypothetical protein Cni_G08508 [Canna indica]|uniref:Uncharacterized protein n=1 Tax=Canna indica TaxID=4628 RepID=A0AAQ3K0K8_9LILI|nr:hypothetical protein Cni_G08508 [Canna indica]